MLRITLVLLFSLVCVAFANPAENPLILRDRRSVDIMGGTTKLIEDLIENLRKLAEQALSVIRNFTEGIQNQAKQFAEKVRDDVQNLRNRITKSITDFTEKFTNAGSAVTNCIESHRKESEQLYQDSMKKSTDCAENRINYVSVMVANLTTMANEALEFAQNAMTDLKNCTTTNSGNILAIGSCLGTVAIQTEMKGIGFLSQSGLQIARINLSLATLPAALEVCAGTSIVEAGMSSAKIVMDIGSCSASSVMSAFTGNTNLV